MASVLLAHSTNLCVDFKSSIKNKQDTLQLENSNMVSIITSLLTLVLTSLGEKLSEDEVDELLKVIHVGKDGRIDYHGMH